ncbi:TonB-dependent receptor [Parahaliea mediterranea]|uniref:TonB-dependent receptor n=1 Tax=Parahaliea mediterranea TaxID=651086 RepID=UPI000E2EDD59|nr:TonB-dependent receptor [Parahaliea mediterranea]
MSRFPRKPTSLLALAVVAAIGTVDSAQAQLEEVVVTARKRTESLQDVPMAVSAFTANQLQNAQVDNILDLERMTPNVTLTDTGGLVAGAVSVFMRGIGNDPGFPQGIGIYVDDVYLNRTSGSLLEVYDVERIEILKGPQGNLYGRNTIGGAIKYVSREPSEEFTGNVELKTGRFDLRQAKASVSGPLIQDSLYGSFGAMVKAQDGIQTNAFDGEDFWGADNQAYRGSLLWRATDALSVKLSADYSSDHSDPRVPNRVAVNQATLDGISFVINGANQFLGQGLGVVDSPDDASLPTDIDRVNTEFTDGFEQFEVDATTLAMTVNWDVSDSWTVKSVTAQRDIDNTQPFDFDGSDQVFIYSMRPREASDFSQEFQFNYSGENLEAVMGLYYLKAEEDLQNYTFQGPRLRAIQFQEKNTYKDHQELESKSAYASLDWDFTESWQLSVGARYTEDSKEEFQRADVTQGFYALAGLQGFPPGAIVAIRPGMEAVAEQSPLFAYWAGNSRYTEVSYAENTDASDSWSEFTPSAKLTWFAGDDLMFYLGYSTGFKSGGFQRNGGVTTPFEPEVVDNYNLGVKSTWLDGALRLNAEAFFNDYTDKQLTSITLDTVTGDLEERVGNVGELETSGVEVELNWLPPVEGLTFALNVGYLDTDMKEYESNGQNIASSTGIGFSPEWTAQARLAYDMTLGDYGFLLLGTDVSYRSESFTNSPVNLNDPIQAQQVQDEHAIWNALAAWSSPSERWRVALEGRNLEDTRVLTNSYVVGPFVTGAYNMPRTWAVSVGYEF